MKISNYDSIKKENIDCCNKAMAEAKFKQFKNGIRIFSDIGDSISMINVVNVMKSEIERLLANGSLKKDDSMYVIFDNIINNGISICAKSNHTMDEIVDFYKSYENFKDCMDKYFTNKDK